MVINKDCRYFQGGFPCVAHKETGVHCGGCVKYDKISGNILIIKLDAVGDVLRTTSILRGLKEKYRTFHITWLTKEASVPLFYGNPYVDTVLDCSAESLARVQTTDYCLVINLDAAPKSSIIASLADGKETKGYLYNKKGWVEPANPEAETWYKMGLFDDIKKKNKESYQKIILQITGIETSNYEPIYELSKEEKKRAVEFAVSSGIHSGFVIGLNTGAGGRWPQKQWTTEGFLSLITLIRQDPHIKNSHILLYGGPEEEEKNKFIMQEAKGNVIDTGCNNNLRNFAALISLCNILVTGDTLAMHLAIALKKKTVVLFGPTSAPEIELYGRGKKIVPEMDCICCYRQHCNKRPNCMESILPSQVFQSVKDCLS